MQKHKLLLIISLFFLSLNMAAQDQSPVQFDFEKQNIGNGEFVLKIKATPAKGVQLFSIQKISDELPINTSFQFDSSILKYLTDSIAENGALKTSPDPALNNVVTRFYTDSVIWLQKIKTNISGEVESMICNDRTCMPPTTEKFNIALN